MSGGVGPISDISLPSEQPQADDTHTALFKERRSASGNSRIGGNFFTLRQLNCLAIVIVLAASGTVSLEDFSFFAFSLFYLYFLSKVAFPPLSHEAPIFAENSKILNLYVLVGAIIGLLIPIAYIFEGILEGDKQGIMAASPHVFLLASQIFMEGVAFSDKFSLPIRVFVAVFYNSRRISSILDWLRAEMSKMDERGGGGGSRRRMQVGIGLAIINMGFWCFNLFGFLLPFYLPKAFKKYYSANKVCCD